MARRLGDRARFGAEEGVLGEAASAVCVVMARAVGTRGSASWEGKAAEAGDWLGLSPSAAARLASGRQGVCTPESDGTFDTAGRGVPAPLHLPDAWNLTISAYRLQ